MERIRDATRNDPNIRKVKSFIEDGWPRHVPYELQGYYAARALLSEAEGLLLYGDRIVIPTAQREEILERLHDGHQGLTKCRERARMSVWWPGIGKYINKKVSHCTFCQERRPTQRKEPLITSPLPPGPWCKIGADLCELSGRNSHIVVDYYSRDIEIAHLQLTTSLHVIDKLKNMCVRWGIPKELITDNGTQFTSADFAQFCSDWDIHHITSSPHYPQSNGAVERAVGTAKRILQQPDPHLALMCYRATPTAATGVSPARLMTGRQIRTTLPVLEKILQPSLICPQEVSEHDRKAKVAYKLFYDRRHSVHPLPDLQSGDRVRLKLDGEKGWHSSGTVLSPTEEPRSYLIQTQNGSVFRRNRRHLQSVPSKELKEEHSSAYPPEQQENQSVPENPPPAVCVEPAPSAKPSGFHTTSR
ncbi:hypothetical protein NFI96_008643, partial [Prochilodus magdalenae]